MEAVVFLGCCLKCYSADFNFSSQLNEVVNINSTLSGAHERLVLEGIIIKYSQSSDNAVSVEVSSTTRLKFVSVGSPELLVDSPLDTVPCQNINLLMVSLDQAQGTNTTNMAARPLCF